MVATRLLIHMDGKDHYENISNEMKDGIGNWNKNHPCHKVPQKNLAALWSCSRSLWNAEFKS